MIQHVCPRLMMIVSLLAAPPLFGDRTVVAAPAQKPAPPTIVKHVPPEYPEDARRARVQGVVVVQATIGADGKVRDAKVLQSIPLLDAAAVAAVRQWEYTPTLVNGVATPIIMTVKVNFALSNPAAGPSTPGPILVATDWPKVSESASKLALDGKITDAITMLDKFVTMNPMLGDAHFLLARFYEQRAGYSSPLTAAQRRDLEMAETFYVRASELLTDPDIRYLILATVARLYEPERLNDAAQAERYARQLVQEHPAHAESHMYLAQLLRGKGDIAGAADVMRKGRAAVSMPIPGLLMALQYVVEYVQTSRDLSREAQRSLLNDAVASADAILKHPQRDQRDYRLATLGKAMAIETQAERVAQTRKERIALLAEAARWSAPIAEHKNGVPPPLKTPSAAEAAELEWQALQRWNVRLADGGRISEARAAFERYIGERPKFAPAHRALADLLMRAADQTSDNAAKAKDLEQAAVHFGHVINLATDPGEREEAKRDLQRAQQMRAKLPPKL